VTCAGIDHWPQERILVMANPRKAVFQADFNGELQIEAVISSTSM